MITLILTICGGALFIYLLNLHFFWWRRGVKGPRGDIFFGNAIQLYNPEKPRLLQYKDWNQIYGATFGVREGSRHILVTSDPAFLNEVFVKQFDNFFQRLDIPINRDHDKDPKAHLFSSRGARWKRLRAISMPSFSVTSLKKVLPTVEDSTRVMIAELERSHADTGESFNIHQYFMELTLDVIYRLTMGVKESTFMHNPRLPTVIALFERGYTDPLNLLNLVFPCLQKPTLMLFKALSSLFTIPILQLFNEMEEVMKKRREERNRNGRNEEVRDFIEVFLDMMETGEEGEGQTNGEFVNAETTVTKRMTHDEAVAQALVLLLAGFDTTANSLGYLCWVLTQHPEVQTKCKEEIDLICRDEDIPYEDISRLHYMEAVCKEAQRFYPLGPFGNARVCNNTTTVCDMNIEKGTIVQADVLSLHFNRRIWGEDVNEFRPERWLDKERPIPSTAFLAFGAGPRICIGMRLALLEEKLAIAHLLRKFDILPDQSVTELSLHGSLTPAPKTVPVKVQRRRFD